MKIGTKSTYGHVISFRLPPELHRPARKALRRVPIQRIESVDQLLKKVATDFLTGRLVYANSADRAKNPFIKRVQSKEKIPKYVRNMKFAEA